MSGMRSQLLAQQFPCAGLFRGSVVEDGVNDPGGLMSDTGG
jgi:hypothetical protein